jgi:S-adenosylmethionine hydrolase
LYYKRFDPITELSNHYSDVEIGEMLCLFNDAGYLELAVNMGRASTQLGLKKDDMVQIHFIE